MTSRPANTKVVNAVHLKQIWAKYSLAERYKTVDLEHERGILEAAVNSQSITVISGGCIADSFCTRLPEAQA